MTPFERLRRTLLAASGVALSLAGPASAAPPTFVVNATVDAPASPDVSDGVCETLAGGGQCTLRAAVMEANAVAGGGATIVVPAGLYLLTITSNGADAGDLHGDLDLVNPMTIRGAGPSATIVDGYLSSRIFDVAAEVTLRDLAIRRGRENPASEVGGGIRSVGADLTLLNVTLTDNAARYGGGIYVEGALHASECILEGNESLHDGGALYSDDSVRISDSRLQFNEARYGGAVFSLGEIRVERSLLRSNYAGAGGGALYLAGEPSVVVNTTIADNIAGGPGGGVFSGPASFVHVTIAGNDVPEGGQGGGIATVVAQHVFLKNSLLVQNFAGPIADDCSNPQPILSGDYNVIGARVACPLVGELAHTNAMDRPFFALPEIAVNGGFAADFAVAGSSVGAIPAASCSDEALQPLLVDQRGYARKGACDIGARQLEARRVPVSLLGAELIRNGGAEIGRVDAAIAGALPPYWADAGLDGFAQRTYSTPGAPPAAPGSGSSFFHGGEAENARGGQGIDVSELAPLIDAGTLPYRVSGRFGGSGASDDRAGLTLLRSRRSVPTGRRTPATPTLCRS
jgi:hypothetical protein